MTAAQGSTVRTAPGGSRWAGMAIPPTAPGTCASAVDDAGHAAVIKPKPLQAPVAGGFTVDDFTVDEQAGTVTCPAGNTVTLSRTRIATFGVACRDCPLRDRCTTCKTGRKLVLHKRDDLLRAARADWAADPGLREDYMAHRPNVERAVAQVATCRGRRVKLRYRGVAKNHALAQAAHRRDQPAQPVRQGPDPPGRRLGPGHLTWRPARQPGRLGGPAAGQARPAVGLRRATARTARPGKALRATVALCGRPAGRLIFSRLLAANSRLCRPERRPPRCSRRLVTFSLDSRSDNQVEVRWASALVATVAEEPPAAARGHSVGRAASGSA
jgi:hypothetical protein